MYNYQSISRIARRSTLDRRDPDYVAPKYSDEEIEDMYYKHLEEERKEDTVEAREIRSIEEIW